MLLRNTAEDVQGCDVALVAADMQWIPRWVRKASSSIRILHWRGADLDLLWKQGGFPWKAALKGRGAQKSWQGFKDSLLQAQEHSVTVRRCIGRPAWLGRELVTELQGQNAVCRVGT